MISIILNEQIMEIALSEGYLDSFTYFLLKLFVFNIKPFDIFFESLELSFLLESAFLCRFTILYKSINQKIC